MANDPDATKNAFKRHPPVYEPYSLTLSPQQLHASTPLHPPPTSHPSALEARLASPSSATSPVFPSSSPLFLPQPGSSSNPPLFSSNNFPSTSQTSELTVGDVLGTVPHPSEIPIRKASELDFPPRFSPPPPSEPLPFISKLRELLSHEELYGDVLRWGADGTHFIVHHKGNKLKGLLQETYSHANYSSFTRQLNMYTFHRSPLAVVSTILDTSDPTVQVGEYHVWSHPSFVRDRDGDDKYLKPRPSAARVRAKEEKGRGG